MKVFNRQVSGRSLTVFGFETVLISASIFVGSRIYYLNQGKECALCNDGVSPAKPA